MARASLQACLVMRRVSMLSKQQDCITAARSDAPCNLGVCVHELIQYVIFRRLRQKCWHRGPPQWFGESLIMWYSISMAVPFLCLGGFLSSRSPFCFDHAFDKYAQQRAGLHNIIS